MSAPRTRARDLPIRCGRVTARAVTGAGCALALAVLTACGSSGTPSATTAGSSSASSSSATTSSATVVVTIDNFAFTTPASVSPGATVTVRNRDNVAHTVTADTGGAFDDSALPGDSTFTAPSQPGSYPFHCSIHPQMHGVLVVA